MFENMNLSAWWEEPLRSVQKPGRYSGGEWNERKKDPARVRVKVALAFPDLYEIGMSYLGQKILYAVLNDLPDVLAERVFAPWPDLENELRRRRLPLFSLENKIPLNEFDVLGFSLLYELNDTNILTILDLGRIPIRASDRDASHPLVIAGGPAAFNPEPTAEIFDAFLIGDGEEAVREIAAKVADLKGKKDRGRLLGELSKIEGVYVPALYRTFRPPRSGLLAVEPADNNPARIRKRACLSLSEAPFPEDILVPNIQVIFDRVALEAARGCPQRCRFCQATHIYAPYRVRDSGTIIRKILDSLAATGYEDASLSALSMSDYPGLDRTVGDLMTELSRQKISLSLSSLRPKGLSSDVAESIVKFRKTGFTLVPEAGTERLRRVINKNLNDRDILDAAENAFSHGWKLLKLYFMAGLPTEREDDLEGIVRLVEEIIRLGRSVVKAAPRINLSLSSFIPKPHTPFQWVAMDEEGVLQDKHHLVRGRLRRFPSVKVNIHPTELSLLECLFSRGDRALNAGLIEAWKRGARFDSWREFFRFPVWKESLAAAGIDEKAYLGGLDRESPLPWDHIDTGIKKSHLLRELDKALRGEATPFCPEISCADCQGCEAWVRPGGKSLPEERVEIKARSLKPLGEATEKPVRYRIIYSKSDGARFWSHLDLTGTIRRILRRAGIEVAHSEGFHPKMLISYPPALPLGMEGCREAFEFKSRRIFMEMEFLRCVNNVSPAGIRFLEMAGLGDSVPALNDRILGMVYSLDLARPEMEEALRRLGESRPGNDGSYDTARVLVQEYCEREALPLHSLHIDKVRRRLVMAFKHHPQKSVRPQDVIRQVFGIEQPSFLLAREDILWAETPVDG